MSVDETMKVVELVRAGLISADEARRMLGFVDEVTPPVLTTNHTNFFGESYIPAWPSDWSLTVDTVTTTTVPNASSSPALVDFATWKEDFWEEDFWDKVLDHKPPSKPLKPDPEPDILPLHAKRKITLEK